ncbi:MAG: hypothetical protein L3K25_07820 [Gammaproteobacteria bacterium]|nr:hypothetical protein [Gammaproteobacteria bacterium]
MTTANTTIISSPPPTPLATSMDRVVLTLNAIEQLVVLSSGIVDAVHEGESYEMLTRQLDILHKNLLEVSALASRAKFEEFLPVIASSRYSS